MPPRCAIVPPVPVPYREPLFARLAERGRIEPRVVYLSGVQPGWDMRPDWFSPTGSYPYEILAARQRRRAGRTPILLPTGLAERAGALGRQVRGVLGVRAGHLARPGLVPAPRPSRSWCSAS